MLTSISNRTTSRLVRRSIRHHFWARWFVGHDPNYNPVVCASGGNLSKRRKFLAMQPARSYILCTDFQLVKLNLGRARHAVQCSLQRSHIFREWSFNSSLLGDIMALLRQSYRSSLVLPSRTEASQCAARAGEGQRYLTGLHFQRDPLIQPSPHSGCYSPFALF